MRLRLYFAGVDIQTIERAIHPYRVSANVLAANRQRYEQTLYVYVQWGYAALIIISNITGTL